MIGEIKMTSRLATPGAQFRRIPPPPRRSKQLEKWIGPGCASATPSAQQRRRARSREMRTALSIGFAGLLAACAGVTPRPQGEGALQGRWEGFVLHDGLREPVSVELTGSGGALDGQLDAGDGSVPLESVRLSGTNVHFEASGGGAFDGVLAGDRIAGSVTGPENGSFSLSRVDETHWSPYFLGP
jgi:hypothetical protein